MPFQKVLCPIDFSEGSRRAMAVAARVAAASNGELVLAHAWYVPAASFPMEEPVPSSLVEQLAVDAEASLGAAVREAESLGAPRVTGQLLNGVPWSAITDMLDADAAFDLVVVGTHGRTGLARILLGSVAEKIVRHAPCSVLAVRPDSEPRSSFSHALVPVDFSDDSRAALDVAAGVVQPGGAGITLLHVVEAPVAYAGELPEPSFLGDLDRRAAEHLERWAAEVRGKTSAPVKTWSRVGWPGSETLAALDHDPTIDLVVMGTHGRTGIKRVLMGSVSEKVVRHARCPVLVARKRG